MVGYFKHEVLTPTEKFTAGCISGAFTRFLTQPLDIVKLRIQLRKSEGITKISWYKMIEKIYQEEGFNAFFQGHMMGQIHATIAVGTQFFFFEFISKHLSLTLKDHNVKYNKVVLNLFTGTLSGCLSATIVSPFEVIRIRQMLCKNQYGKSIKAAKQIYKQGGVLAFYEGLSASFIQIGPSVGIAFTVFSYCQKRIYEWINRNHTAKPTKHMEIFQVVLSSMIAGAVAGILSKTSVYPFELAKRRLQISTHVQDPDRFTTPSTAQNLIVCKKLFSCLGSMYRKRGLLGLYQGWSITLVKAQASTIISFTIYELVCNYLRHQPI